MITFISLSALLQLRMYKKRGRLVSFSSRTAQVTLFIIVGLIILFVFLGLLGLSASVQQQLLLDAKEKVYSDIFSKEALRIYVDRCLKEGMDRGLTLLGRQGRIWKDQFGGREPFVEGITGLTIGANRVFYGLVDDSLSKYPSYQNAYPCATDLNHPEFCRYNYPDTGLGFGAIKLDRRFIQADLERFLAAHTVACVEELVKSEINQVAALETSPDVSFKVTLNTGVITVKVNYPLKLTAGKEEFFHLSQFDFTYPSDFDQLLTTAVLFPLRNDQKYLDFNYTEKTLLQDSFKYKSEEVIPNYCDAQGVCQQSTRSSLHELLGLRMKNITLPNGDDLYQFTLSKDKIIFGSGGEYTYQFVRQNRPPALDYVHRLECLASKYDYLVLQGDSELGAISINLTALDPDEDAPTFSFEKPAGFPGSEQASETSNYFVSLQTVLEKIAPRPEPYIFKARVSDSHQEDYQEVRVLVDQPLVTKIKIKSPYPDLEVSEIDGKYPLSREDPYFLDLTYQTSAQNLRSREVTLEYINDKKNNFFDHRFVAGQINHCFSFPAERTSTPGTLAVGGCADLSFYNDPRYINQFDFPDQLQNPAGRYLSEEGTYSLKATATYCGVDQAFSSNNAKIDVKECIPYRNPGHPYAYPNEEKVFGLNLDGSTNFADPKGDEPINPFLADHNCCLGDLADPGTWELAPPGTACYEEPGPGCSGKIEGYTKFITGYISTTQTDTCNGLRGNVCFGDNRGGGKITKLADNLNFKCGDPEIPSCNKVDSACKDANAWGYVTKDETKGWCHGRMGCELFSTEAVVINKQRAIRFQAGQNYQLFSLVEDVIPGDDNDFFAHSGCRNEDIDNQEMVCDSNFDGLFSGKCINDRGRVVCSEQN